MNDQSLLLSQSQDSAKTSTATTAKLNKSPQSHVSGKKSSTVITTATNGTSSSGKSRKKRRPKKTEETFLDHMGKVLGQHGFTYYPVGSLRRIYYDDVQREDVYSSCVKWLFNIRDPPDSSI